MSCVHYWVEMQNVPINSVDDTASRYSVRDWVQWGILCEYGGDTANVLNYLNDVSNNAASNRNPYVNPDVSMDNPPRSALHDEVSGSAAFDDGIDENDI